MNLSEGRDLDVVARLAAAGGPYVLDVHSDPDHHRSVLTLCGPAGAGAGTGGPVQAAAQAVAAAGVELIDMRSHSGAHPRIGAVDVVPFVSLRSGPAGRLAEGATSESLAARDRFAAWAGRHLGLPCFLYGPERSLPELRRGAWRTLAPDFGPAAPHPTAGATAVGARPVLVAYNLWLAPGPGVDVALAKRLAAAVRTSGLRALGLQVGGHVQVSCNLVDPWQLGPGAAFDAVAQALGPAAGIDRAELVGLLPRAVLDAEPSHRWAELGLDPSTTIEARLEQAGLDGGSI